MRETALRNIARRRGRYRTASIVCVVAVVALGAWWGYTSSVLREDEQAHRERSAVEVELQTEALHVAIERRIGLLGGLETYVILELGADGDFEGFDSIATGLVSSVNGIRNVIIAPNGVNQYVFPIEGNEAALGHDLFADTRPEVQQDVARAVETGGETLSGPYELRQGGRGLVARRPIFSEGEFWGFVTMVVDVSAVVEEAGLPTQVEHTQAVAYVEGGSVFFGDPQTLEYDPVESRFTVDDEVWVVAAAPLDGWRPYSASQTQAERHLALSIAVLGVLVVWLLVRNEARLMAINSELLAATQAKDRFLAAMSHELRTPLNSIIGFSGIMAQGLAGPLTDEQRKQVEMIRTSGEVLLTIVDEVLEMTSAPLSISALAPVSFEIREFVDELAKHVAPLARARGLHFETSVEGECELNTDRGRLRVALTNVLVNAVKYTDEGSVRLEVECQEDQVTFRIRDTGHGMDAAQLGSVFDDFQQIEPDVGGKNPGVGLGLTIARQLVALLGGEMVVESERGVGSMFQIVIPAQCPHP